MVNRLSLVLVFVGKLLVTSGCAGRPSVPSTTTPAWNEARSLALRLLEADYGSPRKINHAIPGVRFLFSADVLDPVSSDYMLLIHQGAIYEGKGLAALGRYLCDVKFLDLPRPPVTSFVKLWIHVVVPSHDSSTVEMAPHYGYSGNLIGLLSPKLKWSQDEAVLSLFYRLPLPGNPGERSRRFGPVPPSDVIEWQIVIPRSCKVILRRKRHMYDRARHRFVRS